MMTHKDKVARRLLAAIRYTDPKSTKESPIGTRHGVRWNEIANADDMKASVFKGLATAPLDGPTATAFDAAGMDRTDPIHWLQLMRLFAWAHYGDRLKPGAPKKRDSESYRKLIIDFSEVKGRKPDMSDEAVFTNLGKRPEYQTKKGRPLSNSHLRKMLKEAKDRERNQLTCSFEPVDP
jgi:hypothetical protein